MSSNTSSTSPARGVTEAAAMIRRGNSVVAAFPPAPAYAIPLLTAALERYQDTRTHPVLLIVPEASFEPWLDSAHQAAKGAGKASAAGPTPARAAHHLASGRVDLLVTTLVVASELIRRSALAPDRLSCLALAWPELEPAAESFVPLFADLPKDTPRLIITTDPAGVASLAERHAWRAPVLGALGEPPTSAADRFQVAAVSWRDRIAALGSLADLSDQDALVVWTADPSHHAAIRAHLASRGVSVEFADDPKGPVVFFDPPPPGLLGQVDAAHSVALAPPGSELYYARLLNRIQPVVVTTTLEPATAAMAADRHTIRERLDGGIDRGALATLAPLFEQHPATDVAVALQQLWVEARQAVPPRSSLPAAGAAQRKPATKVWTNIGKKEGVTQGEWLGLLSLDLGIPRDQFSRIETKDTFTLIEFAEPSQAKAAAERLAGHTFKGRRITARVDRGRTPRPGA